MQLERTLQKMTYHAQHYLKTHSSTILTCIGATGVVVTAVTAVRATPKALKLVQAATDEKGEDLTKLEMVKVAGPAYIPSVVIGASTIACIFGANILNKQQQAALTSAYALVDNAYKEYRAKVRELLGEETDIQIRDAIIKDKVQEDWHSYAPGLNSLDLSDDKQLFYDEIGDRYFEKNPGDVFSAEYHLNRNFTLRGFTNVNEFYMFLGLEETEAGETLGWSAEEFLESGMGPWIDFDHRTVILEDGLECIVISPLLGPSVGYDM